MSPRLVQAFCYFRKSFTHLSIWRLCSQVVFKPKPLICQGVVFFIIVVVIIIFLDLLHHALFESYLVYEQIITIGHRMILKTKMLAGRDVRIESVASRSCPSRYMAVCFAPLCFVSVRHAVCRSEGSTPR